MYYIDNKLSERELHRLNQIPSFSERKIDLKFIYSQNDFFALRSNRSNKILSAFFFTCFNKEYTYSHTLFGKDEYKSQLFNEVLKNFPEMLFYFVFLRDNEQSIASKNPKFSEVSITDALNKHTNFIDNMNKVSGARFYVSDGALMDKNDYLPISNTLYSAKENYHMALNNYEEMEAN